VDLATGATVQHELLIRLRDEDGATLELLRELGVDCAQGCAIARPAPVDEVFGVSREEC
jgi:EAL domain-containing protein (putative c-di-GMP-specific phosphodiesterase class I)